MAGSGTTKDGQWCGISWHAWARRSHSVQPTAFSICPYSILSRVFGTTAETSVKTAGETAAKAGAGKPNVEVLRATAATIFFLLRKTAIGAVTVHDDVDFGACVKRQVGGDGRLLQPRGPKAAKVNPKRVRFV